MVDRADLDVFSHSSTSDADTTGSAGWSSEPAQVAQAATPEQPDAAAGDQAPAAAPPAEIGGFAVETVGTYNAAAVKATFDAATVKVLELPADTQIAAILVNGEDLIIREADGDLILIKGGLKHIPAIHIGTLEIPAEALTASLQAGGVTVPAAGEATNANAKSSGGNFAGDEGHIGTPFHIRDLLPPTAFDRQFEDTRLERGGFRGQPNLPPVIEQDGTGDVTEWTDNSSQEIANTPHTASGTLAFEDPNQADTHTVTSVPAGTGYLGTFTASITDPATGPGAGAITWNFSVSDQAIDHLAAGETITQNYQVTVTDQGGLSTTKTVTILISGTNDAPVITPLDVAGAVTEIADLAPGENATLLSDTGSMTFADVDLTDDHTVSVSAPVVTGDYTSPLGTLTVTPASTSNVGPAGATLSWTFSVQDSALDFLAAGETVTQVFTVTVDDGHGGSDTQDVTILISGTADAPVVTVGGADCTPEDTALSPTFTATPVDASSAITAIQISGLTGWTINSGITLSSGTVGSTSFVGGVLTIHVTGAAAGTAVTATVPMTPPLNSDVDAGILVNATSSYNGTDTTSGNVAATLYVDAVGDTPTNVLITVADSSDPDSSFSNGETGSVHVHAAFSDVDGSEVHTLTVQLAPGFTSSLSASGSIGVYAYTYNSGTGLITITAPSNLAIVDLNIPVTAPASGTLPSILNFDLTATANETPATDGGCGTGHADDPTNNIGSATATTGIPATRLLNGSMITNTNNALQTVILTFVDATAPLDSYSQVLLRSGQGQQGAVLSDAGFNINPSHDFNLAIEDTANSASQVQITTLNLEGITINPPTGNISLDYDLQGSTNAAFTAVINPSGTSPVTGTYSTDGTSSGNTLTDANTALHFTFGSGGNDTLNGESGPDVLSGGAGSDTLNGGSGNDIIVFDRNDLPQINGGDGWDILRIDDGALYNTTSQGGPASGFSNAIVDLTGDSITNIEEILITEEAIPDINIGTTIKITAQNVINFTGTGTDDLYVVGSKGDHVDLTGDPANWVDTGTTTASPGGQVFHLYEATVGAQTAHLYVDQDVTVTGVP